MTPWLLVDIVLAVAGIVCFALYVTRDVPEEEGASKDILIDRAVPGDRLARLRTIQPSDLDIGRRDQPRQPPTPRDIEARRASSYLTRGF